VSAQSFPPVLPLASLLPANGGDGSEGFLVSAADPSGQLGYAVSDAGDVNGDGTADFIVGDFHASPDGRKGESYVVFGSGAVATEAGASC
jgi:hypothetical protein